MQTRVVKLDPAKPDMAQIKQLYKRDYVWLKELSNKGITKVIFKAKTAGIMKLRRLLAKVQFFDRELVILYDDAEHLKEFKRLLDEQQQHDGEE